MIFVEYTRIIMDLQVPLLIFDYDHARIVLKT
jgi:hypothetical protein